MDRRSFVSLTGAAALAGVLGQFGFAPHAQALNSGDDGPRALLVVDLQGGNDPLNTLVPQDGIYYDQRPTLAIPEGDLLTFRGLDLGVHPSLEALRSLWDSDQLVALYGTGLGEKTRSHFVAQDAWRTGSSAASEQTGWLGRWLEATAGPAPATLRSLAIGESSLAAQGRLLQPVTVRSLREVGLTSETMAGVVRAMADPPADGAIGEAQSALLNGVAAAHELEEVLGGLAAEYRDVPEDLGLGFDAAARVIQARMGTQVIYLTIPGFDTHALQAAKHPALLKVVADGLRSFFDDLELSGDASRTLVLVVSEFGRRVAESGESEAAGTDHGGGGLSLLLGPAVVRSRLIGAPDLTDLVDGDLRITLDARILYDYALRWLGATDDETESTLGGRWRGFNLVDF